ncbi:non-ribosomal peptide synthetase [Chitinibacteraceae bacterium HSL-7]
MSTATATATAVTHFPLAPEQRGLWFLHQLAPDCAAYHLLFSLEARAEGGQWPAQLAALPAALMADYPILRASLTQSSDGPQQVMHDHVAPDIRICDVGDLDDDALRERARDDSRLPFNLAAPPLWRVHLYRRDGDRWLAVFVVHHALLDFWSLGLVLQDVSHRLGLSDSALPIDGSGYTQYATQRSAQLTDPDTVARWLGYWHPQLQHAPAVHALPLDAPRPRQQGYEGRSLPFSLGVSTSEAVKAIARAHGATPFMVLLAAWGVLLSRYSGEDDLVIATPVAGRTTRAQRAMLGQFVNTLPLRLRPDAEQSFTHLLNHVRDTVLGALREQDCPFTLLVEELAPRRDPSHAPLAQLGFSWEKLPLLAEFEAFFLAEPPEVEQRHGALTLTPFAVPQQEGQLDLMLEMGGERDGALVGVLKYNPTLLHAGSAKGMADYFCGLVAMLAAQAHAPLKAVRPAQPLHLPQSCGEQKHWPARTLLGDIERRVLAQPAAPAVRDGRQQLDYRALWTQAGRIAATLRNRGIRDGDHVGLMLSRSTNLLAGILGIWRAGAAYVPLDPSFPADRLEYIASDAGLRALLSTTTHSALWPAGIPLIDVDGGLDEASELPLPITRAAYLLYTSGSTGLPKGVRVSHASVRNFLLAMQDLLGWTPDVRLLAVTTPAFDISVLELLLPLLAGGEVSVADEDSLRDGKKMAAWLTACNAMQATPATWKMLVDSGWRGHPHLVALCGGEALSPELAGALHERTGALWNVYGPTETTVWSTAVRLKPGEPVHIGYPIANTQLHVLDSEGHPVPPGMLGELWIGGDGLALDYWRRPELTADRFRTLVTLPQAGRLYRTGDRVRWNAAGHLEHHGRLDFQVKVRGFRIELGEIESVLLEQHGVRDAVVIVREDTPGDARLVAYVVGETTTPALRDALRAALPAYMQPAALVFLEALPQTPNRKIDRRALPAPDLTQLADDHVAPRDAVEIQLAGLFGELLGLPRISVHDSFFDLGGHSLLAVQLVTAIEKAFAIALPVSELLQHATVARLATRLKEGGDAGSGAVLTLKAGQDTQPLWLFHPIGGTVFCYLELNRYLSSDRPVLAIQSPGLLSDGEAEVTIEASASRYIAEIRQRQPHGPYLLGGWCFGGALAFEIARQLRDAGETISGLALIDTRAPIPANVPDDADDATLLSWFARDLATPYGKSLTISPDTLRALPPEAMFDHVLDAAKAINVLPQDADAGALARYFEVYIGNGIALQLYFPEADTLPVLLMRAIDEAEDYGPTLGWSELAPSSLVVTDLAGDHNSIMYAPQAADVARTLDAHYPIQPLAGFST